MQIQRQRSVLIALVPHNRIPLVKFINPETLRGFNARYKFASIEPVQDPATSTFPAINFSAGLYSADANLEIAINRLTVEERKIALHVEGSSEYAHAILDELKLYLTELADQTDPGYLTPVIVTEESELISHLEFSAARLIAPQLSEYADEWVAQDAAWAGVDARIGAVGVEFKVDYLPTDDTFNDRRITLVRKDLVLQSAQGYSQEEQIFASKAPLSTQAHIGFLQELERRMTR